MTKSSKTKSSRRNGGSNGGSYRILDDVLAMAGSLASSRKQFAAVKLESLGQSMRDFAGAMPDIPSFKAYANMSAESLDGLANYIMDSDLKTMAEDAREFARAHPMATLAGSITAGIVATQMMQMRTSPPSAPRARRASGNAGKRRRGARRRSGLQPNRANA